MKVNVESIKKLYPHGTRVRCDNMEDPWNPIPSGMEGTVDFVDDIGQIHMEWDNGSCLALCPREDQFTRL